MKKLLVLMCLLISSANLLWSQQLPYGKFLEFDKGDFRQAKFKYDEKRNSWFLHKNHGLQATANVLSAIAGTTADIRPDSRDYAITVQLGDNDEVAYIDVKFYDDEVYHQVMTFIKDHGRDVLETNSGKKILNQCYYGDYRLELRNESVGVTATTTRTSTSLVKSVDESYNVYHYTIRTNIDPKSLKISKEQLKKAKAKAKGRKDKDVADLM